MNRFLPLALFAVIVMFSGASGAHAAVPSTDLSFGSRGADVTTLQQQLIAEHAGPAAQVLSTIGATGYFGAYTRKALIEFQATHSITPAAGYFGAITRAYMSTHTATTTAPTFSGTLEAVDTSCFSDGVCSATISGKKIILLAGLRMDPPPVGSIKGVDSIGDLEGKIGSTVNVYAATTTNGYDYTLYGNSAYYLEVTQNGKEVSYTGVIGCRPPKNTSGAVIALCSFGLKTDAGTYYALRDTRTNADSVTDYDSTERVTVTGTLAPAPTDSFKAEATIDVTKIEKAS